MNKPPRYTPQERQAVIDRLNQIPEKVCPYLYSNGIPESGYWCVGSIEGEPGKSFKINVAGEKIGWWKDWGEPDEKGGTNFVSLWAKARKISFAAALAQAKAWLDSGGEGPAAAPTATTPTGPRPVPGAAAKTEKPFDWAKCVEKADAKRLASIGKERGLEYEFVSWLRDKQIIGFYGDAVAFPITNEAGVVVGIHMRDQKRKWRVLGGCAMRPLVIGDLARATTIFVFESQWDAFAAWARLGLMDTAGYAAIITRGAANGKLVASLIPAGAKVLVFKQNDEPDEKGRAAADEWLTAVARHAGTPVLLVRTPGPHKDPNDWTRAGGTKVEIEAAVEAATPVEVQPEKTTPKVLPTAPRALNPAQLPDCYYEPSQRQCWFIPNGLGGHVSVNDAGVRRYLRSLGLSADVPDEQFLSPVDAAILALQQQHELAYAGPLAGSNAGIHRIQGSNILVTTSPILITPAPGEWPVLGALLDNLLLDGEHNQQSYLFGWLKVSAEALRKGRRRPSQALVLAGPAGCGKSLAQNLTTIILGGRSAKPYSYMTGGTSFNRDLFTAEHLMVEDEVPSAEYRSRRNFGTHIKGVTVNATQRMHQKFRDALTLEPFWRLTVSVNDEPENLMVLPPIDDSIGDKIILLKCVKRPMPMPANTDEQRQRFWDTLVAELPAFLHWLDEWVIPEELRDERYGITSYHHPELLRAIDDLAPETRLLGLIDDELFKLGPGSAGPWTGTARQLEKKLTSADFADSREARRLFSFNTACGTYLARLEQKYPKRVGSRTKKGYRMWTVNPPEDYPEGSETAAGDEAAED